MVSSIFIYFVGDHYRFIYFLLAIVGKRFSVVGMKMLLSTDPVDSGVYVSMRKPEQFTGELMLNKFMNV